MRSKITAIVPLIALLAGGCTADADIRQAGAQEQKNKVAVTVMADISKTRVTTEPETEGGVTTHVPKWEAGDKIAMFTTGATVNNNVEFAVGDIQDGVAGKFTGTIEVVPTGGEHTFLALYPWAEPDAANNNLKAYKTAIPTVQNPGEAAIDPKAYLAVSSALPVNIAAGQTSVEIDGFGFKRLGALAVLNFKNDPASGIPDTEKVQKVTLTVDDATYVLAGEAAVDLEYAAISEFTAPSNSVTAVYSGGGVTIGEFATWLVVNPGVITEGKKVTLKVITENYIVSRQITAPEDGIVFDTDKVARLDITLNGNFEYRTGVSLPYVFSLKAAGTTDAEGMLYNSMNMSDGSAWVNALAVPALQLIEPDDDSGMTMTFWKPTASTSGADKGVRYRAIATDLDNVIALQMYRREDLPAIAHVLFTYPVSEPLSGRLRFIYGMAASNWAPRAFVVRYSLDNENWSDAVPAGDNLHLTISKPDAPNYFTAYIDLEETLDPGDNIYIRLTLENLLRLGTANTDTSVNDNLATEGAEARLHSAVILDRKSDNATTFPVNAVYSEGFDRMFGGTDYLLGADQLNGLTIYSGDDISLWNETKKVGITGENVSERTGYIQIGHAAYNAVKFKDLKDNAVGSLVTPALASLTGASDLTLTFKAMAYKTGSSMSNAADKEGDKTSLVVEILGGGTVGGQTSVEKTGMSYTEFTEFSVDIDGATADTQIKFTSTAEPGEFTRWFLDDVCVVKK